MGRITYCDSLKDSEIKYTKYISNHIRSVWSVYYDHINIFKTVFPEVFKENKQLSKLINNLRSHDRSKHSPQEFHYYRAKFFPAISVDTDPEKIEKEFDTAWLHHAHTNPHHPAYWALFEDGDVKIFDMPDIYIIEMICDWLAMSIYYNSSVIEYWESEKAQKLPMSEYTKSKVNEFMDTCKNIL